MTGAGRRPPGAAAVMAARAPARHRFDRHVGRPSAGAGGGDVHAEPETRRCSVWPSTALNDVHVSRRRRARCRFKRHTGSPDETDAHGRRRPPPCRSGAPQGRAREEGSRSTRSPPRPRLSREWTEKRHPDDAGPGAERLARCGVTRLMRGVALAGRGASASISAGRQTQLTNRPALHGFDVAGGGARR